VLWQHVEGLRSKVRTAANVFKVFTAKSCTVNLNNNVLHCQAGGVENAGVENEGVECVS